jgi:DNA-directed RNA polymerase specialized sigma24 family protein
MHPFYRQSLHRDEDYIRMIRAGGTDAETAIQDLYLQYRQTVKSSFIKLIHRFPDYRGQPDDLLHDSFLLLLRKIESGPEEIQSLVSFWRGLGRGLLLNKIKKDDRIHFVSEPETTYSPHFTNHGNETEEWESQEQLAHLFFTLGPRCREILLLWIDRYTMSEIASRLAFTNVAMVRKMKYACFKKLKNIVRTGNKTPGSRHIPYE